MKTQIWERTEMTLRSSSGICQEEHKAITTGSCRQDDSAPRVHLVSFHSWLKSTTDWLSLGREPWLKGPELHLVGEEWFSKLKMRGCWQEGGYMLNSQCFLPWSSQNLVLRLKLKRLLGNQLQKTWGQSLCTVWSRRCRHRSRWGPSGPDHPACGKMYPLLAEGSGLIRTPQCFPLGLQVVCPLTLGLFSRGAFAALLGSICSTFCPPVSKTACLLQNNSVDSWIRWLPHSPPH